MEIGKRLYKYHKDHSSELFEFYTKNKDDIHKTIKELCTLKEIHNALQGKYGKMGTEVYKMLKDGDKL